MAPITSTNPVEDLITLDEAASLLKVARCTWTVWVASGKAPKAKVRIGRQYVRWSKSEVLAWVEAGMPAHKEWEARKRAR